MSEMLRAGAALQGQVEALVHAQRLAGASWADVGKLLGITRQSAHERWRYLDSSRVLVCRSRDGEYWAQGEDTGAVVWDEQIQQVGKFGVIVEHHPRTLAALPSQAALEAAADA